MDALPRIAGPIALGLAMLLAMPAVARADRYRVRIGSMPPAYVNDSATYCNQLGGQPPGVEPAPPLAVPPPATPDPPPSGALPPGRDRSAGCITPQGPEPMHCPHGDTDTCVDPPTTPPSAAFLADLANNYSITDQANITALWKWYLKEPSNLDNGEKTGNSVIRQIMAVGGPLVPTSSARPDLLRPNATRGTVRSANGVVSRSTPWGKSGASLGQGTSVTIIPPANGVWYNVEGVGWVCGLWLDLR